MSNCVVKSSATCVGLGLRRLDITLRVLMFNDESCLLVQSQWQYSSETPISRTGADGDSDCAFRPSPTLGGGIPDGSVVSRECDGSGDRLPRQNFDIGETLED